MFIVARLVDTPEAYEGKTNQDIEGEILKETPAIPYVARIEKVTVLECPGRRRKMGGQTSGKSSTC
ncbi:MAG: hypothetical protein QMD23_08130 [Candidatus Bathyarchaeia archaeon]|nr:hypothetical protein [Candidatus Bathyarchaeia archaeon]